MILKKNLLQYLIIAFLLTTLLFLFIYLPTKIIPAEDSVILYQYSENFSNTGIISYNLHEAPVEGATDFLWMIILSGFHFIGLETFLSATCLSMIALIGTAYVLYKILRINNINYFLFFILLLIILPTTPASIVGFSPLFFGFFIVLSIYYFLEDRLSNFAFFSFVTCLIRPDGVVFVVPLIIFSIFLQSKETISIKMEKTIAYFILPGLLYFFWRYWYFKEFFPLPFYVKSSFERFLFIFNLESLRSNLGFVGLQFLPLILFVIVSIRNKKILHKPLLIFISSFIIPFIFYSSMSIEQNVFGRFQYPLILVLITITTILISKTVVNTLIRGMLIIQLILFLPYTFINFYHMLSTGGSQIGYLAKDLNKITTSATMMTTEAGLLSYYSKWETIDPWGLNTPRFAQKIIQPDDIKSIDPDLIVIHIDRGIDNNIINKIDGIGIQKERSWKNMCTNIIKGIDSNDYKLCLVPMQNKKGSFSDKFVELKSKLIKSKSEVHKKNMRYDCFYTRKGFKYFNELSNLLKEYGGITLVDYLKIYGK